MTETLMQDGRVRLFDGDCREVLKGIATNSIDSGVMDPPYALVSISKRFGKEGAAPAKHGTDGAYARASAGFMGKTWDTGEAAFSEEFWAEVYRVLKPGAHVVAFGGTRTYHRLACAIEDAGFEIRDQIGWVYGSGFPKSHNQHGDWEGWGTALKPAWEPICLARKPLIGTVAKNLSAHGTGALNIEDCRVEGETEGLGRWPANIMHDGSDDVVDAFPEAKGQTGKALSSEDLRKDQNVYGAMTRGSNGAEPRGDTGSAARFFYCAKASRADRDAGLDAFEKKPLLWSAGTKNPGSFQSAGTDKSARNSHPTVKPTSLMQYLCRLVTPPGGVVLDPFMGSGSTGKAAVLEGFQFVGIEREVEYIPIAAARVAWAVGWVANPDKAVSAKPRKASPANDNQLDVVDWINIQNVKA